MRSLRVGDFTIDPAAGEIVGPAGRQKLDPKVMQVFLVLARNSGDVVSRRDLMAEVWPDVVVGDDAVSRCIYQLRRHLRLAAGDAHRASLVETLPKRGYRLLCDPPVEITDAATEPAPDSTHPGRSTSATRPHAMSAAKRRSRTVRIIAACAVLVLAALALGHAWRVDLFWRDPLDGARITRATDVQGVAPGVAISRDGTHLAFLADSGGRLDAWAGPFAHGGFRNVTRGRIAIDNPVRPLAFVPDGSRLAVWSRGTGAGGAETIRIETVALAGGPPRPLLDDVAEVDWSPDGRRMVYHPAAPGDPMFVSGTDVDTRRRIHVAPLGVHCHFPLWAPDGTVYFVQGRPPADMDIWRVSPDGGTPERVTFHAAQVSYPVFLDATTLLYLATAPDGTGPWLHGMDTRRRVAHRIGAASEPYTSIAASRDGRRLVATKATRRTALWRVEIKAGIASRAQAQRIALPAAGGHSPRLAGNAVLLVSPSDGSGLRRLGAGGRAVKVWHDTRSRLIAAPAVDPRSGRIAFAVVRDGRTYLHVANADGGDLRTLAAGFALKGAPAWSPEGAAIVIGMGEATDARLYDVPVDGTPAVPIATVYSRDAAWSPDGRFLVFNAADIGPRFPLGAMTRDGRPHPLPAITLPRGARRVAFLPGGNAIVVMKGPAHDRNFWRVDIVSGDAMQLTDFKPGFAIGDFDVSRDGSEIVFDELRDESDVIRIELARR